jgi:PAS domain S-box-containing protein
MEKLRSILDSSPDSITVTDENGVIVDCNKATLKNLGYANKEDLVGKSPLEIIAEKDHERARKNMRIAAEKGMVRNIEYEILRKDGHVYPASLSAAVIKDASGEMRGFVAITKNITKQKQAENALKKSEALLREQKKALEQKNIALREIIAQIEIEKRKIKDDVAANAANVLLPILDKFKADEMTTKYIYLLRHHLQKLTSSYGSKMSDVETKLTSREMEICSMVKGGLSNKDISRLLNISDQTVEGHRKKIRRKLGLTNKSINLTAYLRRL